METNTPNISIKLHNHTHDCYHIYIYMNILSPSHSIGMIRGRAPIVSTESKLHGVQGKFIANAFSKVPIGNEVTLLRSKTLRASGSRSQKKKNEIVEKTA